MGTVAGCWRQQRVAGFWLLVVGSKSGGAGAPPSKGARSLLLPATSNQQPTTVFFSP
jgi:hypothetical protein